MKKLLKYITATCLGIFSLNSCSDDDAILKLNPANFVAPTITSTATTAALSEDTQTNIAYVFNWTPANYGINTVANYSIEIVKEGDSFDNAKVLTTVQDLTYEVNGTNLNAFVVDNLGLTPSTEATIQYRIVASLGTQQVERLASAPRSITLTPFTTDLSTPWGLVGSATPNGWNGPDVPFWKTTTPNVFVAYSMLQPDAEGNSEFKIRKDNAWAENYGGTITATTDTGFSGTLSTDNAPNIPVAIAGNYKITINLSNNTFTAELFQWGIVGSATPNGWAGPDAQTFSYDGINDVWYANNVTFTTGEIKFRQNNAWDVNYGAGSTPGSLTSDNGANIAVTAGTYNVIFDIKNLTYSITPVE